MKTKFMQLPVSLKLVVIWFFLLGLSSYWRFGIDVSTRQAFNIGSMISGTIECGLAIGLINRSNESRWWAASFTFLGSLFGLFILAIAVFEDPNSVGGLRLETPIPQPYKIIFLVVFFVINIIVLCILLLPKTKILFLIDPSNGDN